jgi:hypothetical protein
MPVFFGTSLYPYILHAHETFLLNRKAERGFSLDRKFWSAFPAQKLQLNFCPRIFKKLSSKFFKILVLYQFDKI